MKCEIESCVKPLAPGRKMCWMHISRIQHNGSPFRKKDRVADVGKKFCSKCDAEKPVSEFGKMSRESDGYSYYCKSCAAKRSKNFRERHPERISKWNRESKLKGYGLTPKEFEEMQKAQDYRCFICEEIKPLCVDHCHKTGRVRGLLCQTCNKGLGIYRDDENMLIRAALYLRTN